MLGLNTAKHSACTRYVWTVFGLRLDCVWLCLDGFLSVTLQRQNFQVLAGCAPSLGDQVQGRLGRPLSEVPEFWRAAPEAAVLWGGDEFDYPPSPREGATDPGALELGLQLSGVGHLRAAGLRL